MKKKDGPMPNIYDDGFCSYRKVLIIGVSGVGKRTFMNLLAYGTKVNESFSFTTELRLTSRIAYTVSETEKMFLNVTNIEVEDEQSELSYGNTLLLNCDLIIAILDITIEESLAEIIRLMPSLNNQTVWLLVNKIDLRAERTLSAYAITQFKASYPSTEVFEVSLSTKENYDSFMMSMYKTLYPKLITKVHHTVSYRESFSDFREELSFKLCLLGNSTVGKTAMTKRFFDNFFHEGMASTIGMDVQKKTISVNSTRFRFEIWDIAGQQAFRQIPKTHYRKADAFMVLYDVTNRDSFEGIQSWINDVKEETSNALVFIVGNKIDKIDSRMVEREEAENYAKNLGLSYYEISCKYGLNILEVMTNIILELYKKMNNVNTSFLLSNALHDAKQYKKGKSRDDVGCC